MAFFNEAFQSINDKTYDYVKGLFPTIISRGCIQIDALKCLVSEKATPQSFRGGLSIHGCHRLTLVSTKLKS